MNMSLTDRYMQAGDYNALKHYAKPVANAVGMLADKIIENKERKLSWHPLARAESQLVSLVKDTSNQI